MNVGRFAAGLIVIVLGALMLAEGVLGWITGTSLFYEGINHSFEFVVGFIAIVLAAPLLEEGKKQRLGTVTNPCAVVLLATVRPSLDVLGVVGCKLAVSRGFSPGGSAACAPEELS